MSSGEDNSEMDARIERKSLTRPISKDNLQASTLNQRFDFNFQELRNTVTSEADCVNGRNLAEHQLCVRVDLDFFAAPLESPFAGAPGFRVPKNQSDDDCLPQRESRGSPKTQMLEQELCIATFQRAMH